MHSDIKEKNMQTLKTFYVASYDPGKNNKTKKKCCLALPNYMWDIFFQNIDKYSEENASYLNGGKVSASQYLRLILKKFLIKNGYSTTSLSNEWSCFQEYCKSKNKTYVSVMQEIILGSYNGVGTIFDVGAERLHHAIFGSTYSDSFNVQLGDALENLSEAEMSLFESIYSISSVKNSMVDAAMLKSIRSNI